MRATPFRRLAAAVLLTAAAVAPGCGGPSLVPVEGAVTLDGKPLPEVEVVFVPDPSKGTRGRNATAYTDAQGRFKLADGLPPGAYRVTVTDPAGATDLTNPGAAPPGGGVGGPAAGAKRPRVPAEYTDPDRTPLRDIEVKPGQQPLAFDVKSK